VLTTIRFITVLLKARLLAVKLGLRTSSLFRACTAQHEAQQVQSRSNTFLSWSNGDGFDDSSGLLSSDTDASSHETCVGCIDPTLGTTSLLSFAGPLRVSTLKASAMPAAFEGPGQHCSGERRSDARVRKGLHALLGMKSEPDIAPTSIEDSLNVFHMQAPSTMVRSPATLRALP
jgi:hypothetical protein